MKLFTQLDQFDFHQTLGDTSGICIVFFTAANCGSCLNWQGLLGSYRARHPEIQVFKVDCEQDQGLAREFNVFHLPALFLYLEGQFHCELQCEAGLEVFASTLSQAISDPAQDSP